MAFFKEEKRRAKEAAERERSYAERWVGRSAVAGHFGVDETTVRRNKPPFDRIRRHKLGGAYRYSWADVMQIDRELDSKAYAIAGDGAAVEHERREQARGHRALRKEDRRLRAAS